MSRTFIIICSFCIFTSVIVPEVAGQRSGQDLPPAEIIDDSYHAAHAVICMDVDTTRISDSVMTDSGRTGYVCLQFTGSLKESFKGIYGYGEEICIDNWMEFNPRLLSFWRDQKEIIFFIDRPDSMKDCRRVMENGMFVGSDTLRSLIRGLK
jgi:hypothetical protein